MRFKKLIVRFDQHLPSYRSVQSRRTVSSHTQENPRRESDAKILLPITSIWNGILGCSKGFGQRLPWNIGLLLRKLWVVVCFHSRRLMICKHGLFTANRWAKRPWNMPYTRMFTNSKASAMESDNNSQLTQYQSNGWRKQPLHQFFWKSQYVWFVISKAYCRVVVLELLQLRGWRNDDGRVRLRGNTRSKEGGDDDQVCSLQDLWQPLCHSDGKHRSNSLL